MLSDDKPSKPVWLAFRCRPELARRIDELASRDRRSRASWLTIELEKIAQQQPTGDHP
jgi:predicted transcriptional regulator